MLMLLPAVVVDVKTTFGRCYYQVADVIATIGCCVWFSVFFLLNTDRRAMGLLELKLILKN